MSNPLMGLGIAMQGYGRVKANLDQAMEEEMNAGFYREQAEFSRKAGDRQKDIFDRESEVLYGEQLSAFAKAGVDTSSNSLFMAKTMLFRDQESNAIKEEADFRTRLAMLRADQAQRTADSLSDPFNNAMQVFGMGLNAAGSQY
jgi:hypothetical protein